MRSIIVTFYLLFLVIICSGQQYVPFPCLELNQAFLPIQNSAVTHDVTSGNCIETNQTIEITGPTIETFSAAEKITLKSGFHSEPDNIGKFSAKLIQPDISAVIYEPITTPGIVTLFDKLEIGLKLPQAIEDHVSNFISNTSDPDRINPYNPEQIDIVANFYFFDGTQWVGPSVRYGFYFEDYQRSATDWTPLNTEHKFRVRFATDKIGKWKLQLSATINGITNLTSDYYYFECVPGPNKGYIKKGSSGEFFVYSGTNETFFPVGQNLRHPECPEFEAGCDALEAYTGTTAGPKTFTYHLQELEFLAESGANYFRMLQTPWTTEIEFEQLNNYTSRLHLAWEMDQILDKCKELNLIMHWNLSVHYVLENPAFYGMWAWDWSDEPLGPLCPGNTGGYCYKTALGLSDPIEFFTSPGAVKNYKYRLRYMVSRWGYSTNIGVMELFSEINNAGNQFTMNPPDAEHVNCFLGPRNYSPYNDDPAVPAIIMQWHDEMSTYIKTDLSHAEHLIAVSYAGEPKIWINPVTNLPEGDFSFSLPNVDLPTWNFYSHLPSRTKNYYDHAQSAAFLMHSESGAPGLDECGNNAEWIRTAWSSAFSGLAGMALNWSGHHDYDLWAHFGRINEVLSQIDLNGEHWYSGYDIRDDEHAEVFYLKSSDDLRAAGVILNTGYNYWNQSYHDPSCLDDSNENLCGDCDFGKKVDYPTQYTSIFPSEYRIVYDVNQDPGNERLRIAGLDALSTYNVDYYDAFTGNYLGYSQNMSGVGGDLTLLYPDLLLLNGFQPIIYFKLYKNGTTFLPGSSTVNQTLTNDLIVLNSLNESTASQVFGDITIFPNPATNEIQIESEKSKLPLSVEIINANGKMVFSTVLTESQQKINISNFARGVYSIRFSSAKSVIIKKIVVL